MKSLITGSLLAMLLVAATPSDAFAGSFSVYIGPPYGYAPYSVGAYWYPYWGAPPVYWSAPYWYGYGGYRHGGYYGGHSHWRGHRGGHWGGHRGGGRGGHGGHGHRGRHR